MGWHYLPPGMFPFALHDAHAGAELSPIILRESSRRADLLALANEFRRFRWCIRQSGIESPALQRERALAYRATLHERRNAPFALIITTKPKLLAVLLDLNPSLKS